MVKKTKTAKALPSALTVARPTQAKPKTAPAAAKSAVAEAASPAASTLTPQPPLAPKVAVREKTPSTSALQAVKISFALHEPQAKKVALCGGFNAWSPEATPLNRQADGRWETKLALQPGRYEYKFVVDGHWLSDPNAQTNVPNGYGTLNSVVEVRP